MRNGLNFNNTQQNSIKFSGMLGEIFPDHLMAERNLFENYLLAYFFFSKV